jgi:hypothetical protein
MSNTPSVTSSASAPTQPSSQSPSDDLASPAFLLAKPNPDRWQGHGFRELLGLEPRILAAPLPHGPVGKKATQLSVLWNDAHARLYEASGDQPLKIAQRASDICFDRLGRKPKAKAKLPHLVEDLFDPGTKLMRSIELASRALFDPAADGTFPNVDFIDRIANDLIAFHDAHDEGHDIRFVPLRSMGRCLQTLVRILRQAQ